MTFMQRLIEALEARLWKFVRIVHSANHDYPYHDYFELKNENEQDTLKTMYTVGTGNVNAHGDQSKRFVSKRMLIWQEIEAVNFRLNDSRNVLITTPIRTPDGVVAMPVYGIELHANINVVYLEIPPERIAHIYCEGVLPEEARDAE